MAEALRPQILLLAYWLVMVLLAAFFLRMACSLCRTGMPTWRRAILSVLLVTFLAYLTFDFAAYLLMRSMDDIGGQIPSWYGYNLWFREAIGLKWLIISHAGPFRFLPVVLALFVAALLQFIVLQAQVTFGIGLFIVILQWGATLVAGYIVSLLFGVILSTIGWSLQPGTGAKGLEQAPGRIEAGVRQNGKAAQGKKTAENQKQLDSKDRQPHEEPKTLEKIESELRDAAKNPREYLQNAGEGLKAYANSNLDDLKEQLAPLTRHLPEPAQNFLDKGGWWLVLGFTGLIAFLWLRSILRRLGGAFRRPTRRKTKLRKRRAFSIAKEKLAWITSGFTDSGPEQLTVKSLPARVRLVILSPGSRNAADLTEDMSDRVLDWIKPGLAEVASHDQPGVRVWPPFYSSDGFANALRSYVPIPEPKGMKSHWVLVAGHIKMGRVLIHVGLAVHADQANSLRFINVKSERWLGVLGIENTREEAAFR